VVLSAVGVLKCPGYLMNFPPTVKRIRLVSAFSGRIFVSRLDVFRLAVLAADKLHSFGTGGGVRETAFG
jgi:hypothetical protein